MKKNFALVAGALVLTAAAPVFAHHSFAAEFDASKAVRLTGTLTKIEWTNRTWNPWWGCAKIAPEMVQLDSQGYPAFPARPCPGSQGLEPRDDPPRVADQSPVWRRGH